MLAGMAKTVLYTLAMIADFAIAVLAYRSGRTVVPIILVFAGLCFAIAAIGSHLVVYILGIRTGGVGYKLLGGEGSEPLAFAEGSSLMVEGLGWDRISRELGVGIENWFVAGSSPSEWEALQPRARNASTTFTNVDTTAECTQGW
jgi:hypothetical protein